MQPAFLLIGSVSFCTLKINGSCQWVAFCPEDFVVESYPLVFLDRHLEGVMAKVIKFVSSEWGLAIFALVCAGVAIAFGK